MGNNIVVSRWIENNTKKKALLYVLPSLFRLWIGNLVGVWFPFDLVYDDALIMEYARFDNYFHGFELRNVMLKELGMPLFLQVVNISGIPYPLVLSILWIITAAVVERLFYLITNKSYGVFYIITLFMPVAFDSFCGTRLYRSQLLVPMYILCIGLAIILICHHSLDSIPMKNTIVLSVVLGFVFTFTYYIKEDGIWLLAVIAFFCVLGLVISLIKRRKLFIPCLITLMLPFLIFGVGTLGYKAINYHYFGVFEINTRTDGEQGEFLNNIMRIGSDDRTNRIWTPRGALDQAFEVSNTLQENPQFIDTIYHSPWALGDIDANPLQGDFLGWAVKDAVFDSGIATNQVEKEDFFRRVNDDLEQAFIDGRLHEDENRIQIIGSIGGKTPDEIYTLMIQSLAMYRYHILLETYDPGAIVLVTEPTDLCYFASDITNVNLVPYTQQASIYRLHEASVANKIVSCIFTIYKVLYPILLIASLLGLLLMMGRVISNVIRKRKQNLMMIALLITELALLGISYIYSFAIAMFCTQYAEPFIAAEKMYSSGLASIFDYFT